MPTWSPSRVKPNFRALGKRFGSQTKLVAAAVTSADAGEARPRAPLRLAGLGGRGRAGHGGARPRRRDRHRAADVRLGGGDRRVDTGTGETVALDLTITDDLRRSGLIRDVIRLVQDTRKSTGLAITDRIDLWWSAGDADLAEALRTQGGTVADEVLAVVPHRGRPRMTFPSSRTPTWA